MAFVREYLRVMLEEPAGVWTDIIGDFTSVTVNRSSAIEAGALFRPEVSTATLTTRSALPTDLYGKTIKVLYGVTEGTSNTLFQGYINERSRTIALDDDAQPYEATTLVAMDRIEAFNKVIVENFTAPQQNTYDRFHAIRTYWANRVNGAVGVDIPIFSAPNNSYYTMPAVVEPLTGTALELILTTTDTEMMRVYLSQSNQLLTATSQPQIDPKLTFSDGGLLTANQSHMETDASGWTSYTYGVAAHTGLWTRTGTRAIKVTSLDGDPTRVIGVRTNPWDSVRVTPGETYKATGYTRAASNARQVRMDIVWRDSANGSISTSVGEQKTNSTSTDTQLTVTGVAPANAAYAYPTFRIWNIPNTTEMHYLDAVDFRQTTNVPGLSYTSVDFAESLEHVTTGVTVSAASDESVVYSRRLTGSFSKEAFFRPDVVPTLASVTAWANDFPLQNTTSLMPTALSTEFDAAMSNRNPTDKVRVTYQGTNYDCGIGSMSYTFTPNRGLANFGLFPGYVLPD